MGNWRSTVTPIDEFQQPNQRWPPGRMPNFCSSSVTKFPASRCSGICQFFSVRLPKDPWKPLEPGWMMGWKNHDRWNMMIFFSWRIMFSTFLRGFWDELLSWNLDFTKLQVRYQAFMDVLVPLLSCSELQPQVLAMLNSLGASGGGHTEHQWWHPK